LVATIAKVPALVPMLRVKFATVPVASTDFDVTLMAVVWNENIAPVRFAPLTVRVVAELNSADFLLNEVMMGIGPMAILPT